MAPSINWARGLLLFRSSKGDPCITAATAGPADPGIPLQYADYADLFNKEIADMLPVHQEWDHRIPLEEEKLPPYGPITGLTSIEVEALQKEVDKNIEQEFIQPLTLPAEAPVLVVKKKDKGLRLCIDYRGLNQITIKSHYALPLIGELIDRLQDAQYFTRINLGEAYNLVHIAPGEE